MRTQIVISTAAACAGLAAGQVAFDPISLPGGGEYTDDFGMISGVNAVDFDNDGDIDVFLPVGDGQPSRLLQNDGTGSFTDVAAEAGLTDAGRNRIALFFDYDADGLLDLVPARDCHSTSCPGLETVTLYRQASPGQFVDVTPGSGLEGNKSFNPGTHMAAFSAGDLDSDGWLDLVLATWNGQIWVYLNNEGDGTFTDISVSSGLSLGLSFYWQPVINDFNDDGLPDIFIGVDFLPDQMWINQGDGAFVNIAPDADCDVAWNGMGVSLGDIENDGDWDIYVSNISVADQKWSTLYVNLGGPAMPSFLESSVQLETDPSGWAWGNTFFDYDHDGDVDLAVTNGRTGGAWAADQSRVYENTLEEIGVFTNVSDQAGFNDTYVGSTVLAADIDRDGDMDLIQSITDAGNGSSQGLLRVLRSNASDAAPGGWLVIRPRMTTSNTHAIGAVVTVEAGGESQMRVITAGISMAGQEPAEAHFGMGPAASAPQVIIEWPNGLTTVRTNVPVNQIVDITAPLCGADIDASGAVDSVDLNTVLAGFGGAGPAGDVNADGVVDSSDLNEVLAAFGGACSG